MAEQEQIEKENKEAEEQAVEKANEARLDVGEFKRWDEVKGTWDKGAQGLVELRGGLTESVARGERAGRVVVYLEGK